MSTTTSITAHPRELRDAAGSWGEGTATIHLPTPSDEADAAQRYATRRRNAERCLDEAGASPTTIHTAAAALASHAHDDGAGVLVVVRGTTTLLSQATPEPVTDEFVAVDSLPHLLPVFAASQARLPHLAVLLDRTGADLYRRTGTGAPLVVDESEGSDDRIHRSHPGGWSQRRFQQIAENAWENNAKEVVEDVLGDHGDTELIVVGGDERAVGFFVDHLPERFRPARRVEGSRHGDVDTFLSNVDTEMADLASRQVAEALRETREAVATDRGAAGEDVLAPLSQGRVRTLVIGDDTFSDDRRRSWFDLEAGVHLGDDEPADGRGTCVSVTDAALFLASRLGVETVVAPAAALPTDPPLAAILHG